MKIVISTNKGGVLKTTLTTCLAGAMSKTMKVLIVDMDNQGNCLVTFGRNPDKQRTTIYDVLVDGVPVEDAIVNVHENIDILPANDDMKHFDFEVIANKKRYIKPYNLLREALRPIEHAYDVILIDTPPNLGLAQGNALNCADQVLIPFQPESYSMRSFVKILEAINDFKSTHNPNLSILGVVATLVDNRTSLHSQVLEECRKYCDKQNVRMFETVIPKSIRFASSVGFDRLPATLSDPKNDIVNRYYQLLEEVNQVG